MLDMMRYNRPRLSIFICRFTWPPAENVTWHNVARKHLRQLIAKRLFEGVSGKCTLAVGCLGAPSVGGRGSAVQRPSRRTTACYNRLHAGVKQKTAGYRSLDWRVVFIVTGDLRWQRRWERMRRSAKTENQLRMRRLPDECHRSPKEDAWCP